jgi:hypothetical protein
MTTPWTSAKPSGPLSDQSSSTASAGARVVQHHYVRAELRQINTHGRNRLLTEAFTALKLCTPKLATAGDKKLMEAFDHMTRRLQQANLTINFQALAWFAKPNPYESYTQMYERAIKSFGEGGDGKVAHMVMKGDSLNPATTRANADDRATFGSFMTKKDGSFKPEFGGIGRMMSPGGLKQTGTDKSGNAEYVASNPYFNPKAKQVFAALDYGRRPHGSCIYYGKSMMVLNEKLKTNAIFFAGDTFFASDEATKMTKGLPPGSVARVGADHQVSYELLGALLPFAGPKLRQELVTSCLLDALLKDTAEAELLVEAHLFEPILFKSAVDKMFVVLEDKDGNQLDKETRKAVQANADDFCKRNAIKLRFSK